MKSVRASFQAGKGIKVEKASHIPEFMVALDGTDFSDVETAIMIFQREDGNVETLMGGRSVKLAGLAAIGLQNALNIMEDVPKGEEEDGE